MTSLSFSSRAISALMICLIALSASSLHAQSDAEKVRMKELYVPYEFFQKITKGKSDGLVMGLKEYRALVVDAIRISQTPGLSAPPIDAHIESVEITGQVVEGNANFVAKLIISSLSPGYSLCHIGPMQRALTQAQLNGEPAYLLRSDPKNQEQAYVILDGKGQFELQLSFSLNIEEKGESFHLGSPLFPAAVSKLSLEFDSLVKASSSDHPLTQSDQDGRTTVELSLGNSSKLALNWSRQLQSQNKKLYLQSTMWLSYAPHPKQSVFHWQCRTLISRAKTSELRYILPSDYKVLEVSGEALHRWTQDKQLLTLFLNKSSIGPITHEISGSFGTSALNQQILAPRLNGAHSHSGQIHLLLPQNYKLTDLQTRELREIPSFEAKNYKIPRMGQISLSATAFQFNRHFAFGNKSPELQCQLEEEKLELEMRNAALLQIVHSNQLQLDCTLQIIAKSGSTHTVDVSFDANWKITSIGEHLSKAGISHQVQVEEKEVDGKNQITLHLQKALNAKHPLELQLSLENKKLSEFDPADEYSLNSALPHLVSGGKQRTHLGVWLEQDLQLVTKAASNWQAISQEELKAIGLQLSSQANSKSEKAYQGQAGNKFAAGLRSDSSEPAIELQIKRLNTHGQYRAVTHLMTAQAGFKNKLGAQGNSEQHLLRVRCDIEVAAFDRGVSSLRFIHPVLPANTKVVVLGAAIKEIQAENEKGLQTVHFHKAWTGLRSFRIEYEIGIDQQQANSLPEFSIAGDFGAERFLVLQSQGSVQLQCEASKIISEIDWDDLPDYAEPWSSGRILNAYRLRSSGSLGNFNIVVHDRAPVLSHLAREVKLSTVLQRDGSVKTQADILLFYARQQSLEFHLPNTARVLSVMIDGLPIRALRKQDNASGPNTRRPYHIPLPARSFAKIQILYESRSDQLTEFGSWEESALELPNLAVGEVQWDFYHPEGYRFFASKDGNMQAQQPQQEAHARNFYESFWKQVMRGYVPNWQFSRTHSPSRAKAKIKALTQAELAGVQKEDANQSQYRVNAQRQGQSKLTKAAPAIQLLFEGRKISLKKFGPDARLELSYRSFHWWNFSQRLVFGATLLLLLICLSRKNKKTSALIAASGVFLASTLPLALEWDSPFLWIPLAEACMIFLIALGLFQALSLIWIKRPSLARFSRKKTKFSKAILPLGITLIAAFGHSNQIQAQGEKRDYSRFDQLPISELYDEVLIPYGRSDKPWEDAINLHKVFISKEGFQKLWDIVHPEQTPVPIQVNQPSLMSAVQYHLTVAKNHYQMQVFTSIWLPNKKWVEYRLPFNATQIEKILLDGVEIGVIPEIEHPTIVINGKGKHSLEIRIRGKVDSDLGRYRIDSNLLQSTSALLTARLPMGAKLRLANTSQRASRVSGEGSELYTIALGAATKTQLNWEFPQQEGQQASQTESSSLTILQLLEDNIKVNRIEQLKVTGAPIRQASYQLHGDWQITNVWAKGLTQWNMREEESTSYLDLFFDRAINRSELSIVGLGKMDAPLSLPTLELVGAVHQESYVALENNKNSKRFSQASLASFTRTTVQKLGQSLPVTNVTRSMRIYHSYNSGKASRLITEEASSQIRLNCNAHALIAEKRMLLVIDIEFSESVNAPLQYSIDLPAKWIVEAVKGQGLHNWESTSEGGQQKLNLQWSDRPRPGTKIRVSAVQKWDEIEKEIALPNMRIQIGSASPRLEQKTTWKVAAEDSIQLVTKRPSPWQAIALEKLNWSLYLPSTMEYRFAFQTRRADEALLLLPSLRKGWLAGSFSSFVHFDENRILAKVRVQLKIRQAARSRFEFLLPANVSLKRVDTNNLRSKKLTQLADKTQLLEVEIQSPHLGEQVVDLILSKERKPGQENWVHPIQLVENGKRIEEVEHFVGLIQTTHGLHIEPQVMGLAPIERERLPYLPNAVSQQSIRSTYKASQLDWRIRLVEQKIELAERFDAVIELAELYTLIGNDGTVRTRVVYTLLNESLQFLHVSLPTDALLWDVTVNGKSVAVGKSQSSNQQAVNLQIPVDQVGGRDLPLELILTYEEAKLQLPKNAAEASLVAPKLGNEMAVQIKESLWMVQFPEDYTVEEISKHKKMRQVPPSLRHTEKVESLLQQQEKIIQASQNYRSKRSQSRAAKQLAKIEQELGDNIAELSSVDQAEELKQMDNIGKRGLQEQWLRNSDVLKKGVAAQAQLRSTIEHSQRKDLANQPSADQMAFRDRANFAGMRQWRDGKESDQSNKRNRPGVYLDDYLYPQREIGYLGNANFQSNSQTASGVRSDFARKSPFKPLTASSQLGTSSGLKLQKQQPGYTTFAYRRGDGDSSLRLSLKKKDSGQKYFGLILLGLAIAAIVIQQKRKKASS